ncbi:hypothetical protein ACR0YV_001371 [Enterococcus faecalis]|uniref:hypothetical protein n=1 Tax=Enterococcus faecalis TaxID=1351 RepID=UPI002A5131B3|nr:hypothetical protein [Enterococcus faecalis]EHF1123862.1 hypothetical protein [Enterococcus faecalis]EIW2082428.1 hypothetical protein [Enterococcus faecalis]EJM6514413.1 hypothetical protein [Enterococcus faecalis]MEB7486241.1 hypothetical protein [Enterococcus faecalis]
MRKLVMTATILCGVILAGCHNENTEQALPATGDDTRNEVQKETPISEALNKKEQQIWYLVSDDTPGKDSDGTVLVIEDGKVSKYGSLPLSEVIEMSDKEIIKSATQDRDEQLYTRHITQALEGAQENIDHYTKTLTLKGFSDEDIALMNEQLTEAKAQQDFVKSVDFDKVLSEIEPQKYRFNLVTDSTGNNTEEQEFIYQESTITEDYSISIDERKLTFEQGGVYAKFQIYDEWFCGLKTDNHSYFVMCDPEKTGELSFILDQPGAKGVTVDE